MEALVQSIDQLDSDLESVKRAHETDAEHWSQRSILASQPIEAEQIWAQPNAEQAEGLRVRGQEAQGQFKSAAHSCRGGKFFVHSVANLQSHNPAEKNTQMHLESEWSKSY